MSAHFDLFDAVLADADEFVVVVVVVVGEDEIEVLDTRRLHRRRPVVVDAGRGVHGARGVQ